MIVWNENECLIVSQGNCGKYEIFFMVKNMACGLGTMMYEELTIKRNLLTINLLKRVDKRFYSIFSSNE